MAISISQQSSEILAMIVDCDRACTDKVVPERLLSTGGASDLTQHLRQHLERDTLYARRHNVSFI
jgi:hypothetical protein